MAHLYSPSSLSSALVTASGSKLKGSDKPDLKHGERSILVVVTIQTFIKNVLLGKIKNDLPLKDIRSLI